ncbi:hypothetical protein [Glycomyces sp. YM15]|uniref:hypothetical protein n=1 Tax=Glycomyces sp. YM15 TaxID=2800446 RepID=UPI001964EB90|nr:hypothetical protein [Glycomyces sp. YM15]
MSSTTIRYSGVPENSHSRRFTSEAAAYSTAPANPESGPIPGSDEELAAILRARLRNIAVRDSVPHTEPHAAPQTEPCPVPRSEPGPEPRPALHTEPRTEPLPTPRFTPGKAGPVSSDPRHNPAYPHPKNPGLFGEVDGYYDWAGRRLFLSDGSPDPMTPGAYRYQTRPDLCVLDAADDDPWSPRYEPDHLRHKPGDDWLIDKTRPYDVLDPGPFGSPGWFPDRRTGRHRRDELPDPIPWWEIEEDPEKAEWAERAEALYDRRTRITREREAQEAREANHREVNHRDATDRRPSTPGEGADRDNTDPPEPPSRPPVSEERPSPQPGPRPQPWARPETEPQAREPIREPIREPVARQVRPQHHPHLPRQADRRATDVPTGIPEDSPHRFGKLREDAWDRFIEKSADLAAAHRSPTVIERECGPTIGRIARGIRLTIGLLRHRPKPRAEKPAPPDRHTALAARTARFAGAVRGAQRARTEASVPRRTAPVFAPGMSVPGTGTRASGGAAWA